MRYLKLFTLFMLVVLTGPMAVKANNAGSLVSWGGIAFDSKELDANDFVVIAAGQGQSLVIRKGPSDQPTED